MESLTAKVFISALQTLPEREQLAVFRWIDAHRDEFVNMEKEQEQDETADLYELSMQAFADEWLAEENDVWDQFYKENKPTSE